MRIRKDDGKSDRKLCSKRREKSNWSGQSLWLGHSEFF
jgi:hypothetical protein